MDSQNTDTEPKVYPLLPLRDVVVYPHMAVPLFVGREKSILALEKGMSTDKQVVLVTQKDPAEDNPALQDVHQIGTLATILQLLKLPDGTLKVLEACRYSKISKFIYAASSSCYGIAKNTPTNEKTKISPKYPYAFSKFIGEATIKHWSTVYGINYVSLRLFNVYGTRSRTHGAYGAALGVFLKQKLSGKPFTIVGDGNQKRDFINVKDISEVFYKSFITKKKNKIYNVGSGKTLSVNKLVSLIGGKRLFIPKRPGEPDITHANISLIKNDLNWEPKVSIEDGIRDVLKNINYWKKSTLWTKNKIKKATKDWFKYLKK